MCIDINLKNSFTYFDVLRVYVIIGLLRGKSELLSLYQSTDIYLNSDSTDAAF